MNIKDTLNSVMADRHPTGVLSSLPPGWAERIEQGKELIAARRPQFDLARPEVPELKTPVPGAVRPIADRALAGDYGPRDERARNASRLFRGVPSC